MKKIIYGLIILIMVTTMLSFRSVFADDPKARIIMQKVDGRDDGDNMTYSMLMVLIDKSGDRREKYFKNFKKDYGKDTKKIMFIEKPANSKDMGFLTFDYDSKEKDDDQWLFLPALSKTKRIASSDKSRSFMGSDLNYSDMTDRDLSDYDFKLLKETKLGGEKFWLIESVPRSPDVIEETGYNKSILVVSQDKYMVVKSKSWTEDGRYIKIMDVKRLEKIDGIWVSTEINVTKRQGEKTIHQTLLKLSDIKFNQKLEDGLFTIRRLEKGL